MTHRSRRPVDAARALEQWGGYLAALAGAGWEIIEIPPLDRCPDGVFVEDTAVVFDDLAVICRPGADTRRAEVATTAAALGELGYRLEPIEAPATLDGGDVLKMPRGGDEIERVFVGRSARTNDAGIDQLRRLLAPRGIEVTAVPTTKVLHLKSALTALPDGGLVGAVGLIDDPARFGPLVEAPEEAGAHVLLLGGGRLLLSSGAPRTAEILADRGYEPVLVDIDEFEKLEGCVTCLSIRLRCVAADDRRASPG